MMGDPSSGMVSSRSPIKVPLDYTPNWDNAILNTQTGAPLVIAAVDTCCIPPDMPVKGNLIFRKNNTGTIECSLMLWFKTLDSTYVDWRAPLWTQNTFSGLVALVDAQDTIRRVASYANGSISKVLVWNKNIRDLAEDELGAPPTVDDRGGPKCPRFGKTFWESVEDFFQEVIDDSGSFFNDWWDSINENPGSPPQEPYSFFFYEFSNSPNWTWIPAAGGGGGQPAFENYRVECGIAMQNFIANGFYLPEYAHLDMRLCELLSELYISDNSGTANTRLLCLYTNHQSAYFEEIWQYWDNSGEDQAARTVLNSFLDAACSENPSVQKAAMLRHAYCLGDMSLIDLWNRLTVECGQNFGLEISPCLAEIILSHANTSNSYQCPNGALANIINFVRAYDLSADAFVALVENNTFYEKVAALVGAPDAGVQISMIFRLLEKENYSQEAHEHIDQHLDWLESDTEYRQLCAASIGWSPIMWEIAKELIADKAIDIIFRFLPGFGQANNVKDAIKALNSGDWLDFTFQVGQIVVGNTPLGQLLKAWEAVDELRDFYKTVNRIWDNVTNIPSVRLQRAWDILKNNSIRLNGKAYKYVDDLITPKFGWATSPGVTDYRKRFTDHLPEINFTSSDHVHHAVPQHIRDRYPHLGIVIEQMHSLENLRGIKNDIILPNGRRLHQEITYYRWNPWYDSNPNPTLQDVLDFAKQIDDEFGHLFTPPIR